MANVSPDDAELEHLLTQLLRMVSPAFSADDAAPGSDQVGQVGRSAPASGRCSRRRRDRRRSQVSRRCRSRDVCAGGQADAAGSRCRREPLPCCVVVGGARADRARRRSRHRPGRARRTAGPGQEHGEQAGRRAGAQGLGPARPGRGQPALRQALPDAAGRRGGGQGMAGLAVAPGPDPGGAVCRGARRASRGPGRTCPRASR